MSKDLYVRNLSPQTTEEDIRTLFAVAGKVTYIHLVVDPKTEQFLGCAYVKMSSEAEAKDAISALNEARYMNAHISVTVALPRTPPGSPRPPSPQPQKRAARPAVSAAGVKKKQDRAIAKGDWTGPAPAKKKERAAAPLRRKEGEEGRSASPDWTAKPAGAKKPWEKSSEKKEWSASAPAKKERFSAPSWRKEGEEGRKSVTGTSKLTGGKKPWEKSIAESDWTAAAPARKERASTPLWRKEGEAGRKSPSEWRSSGEGAPSERRKSSAPPRSGGFKKGPGPKRSK